MRIALFSDIHGNALGLREVLADIEARGGADVLFALGDILGAVMAPMKLSTYCWNIK